MEFRVVVLYPCELEGKDDENRRLEEELRGRNGEVERLAIEIGELRGRYMEALLDGDERAAAKDVKVRAMADSFRWYASKGVDGLVAEHKRLVEGGGEILDKMSA